MNNNKIIVTSSSNRFFPWLLNFIGSLQNNYPSNEKMIIYSLGLNKLFLSELKNIKNIEIKEIPKTVNFWRKDYTWKLLMYEDLLMCKKSLIFYIDSGATILKPLDEIFEIIKKDGYFFIDQGRVDNLTKSIPKDYINFFNIIINDIENKYSIASGFTGFNIENEIIKNIFLEGSILAKKGYCLKKGILGDKLKRNCDVFRHDQSILSMILFNKIVNPIIHEMNKYGGSPEYIEGQYIHSHRRGLKELPFINSIKYKNLTYFNKLIIKANRLIVKIYFKTEKILVKISYIIHNIKNKLGNSQ